MGLNSDKTSKVSFVLIHLINVFLPALIFRARQYTDARSRQYTDARYWYSKYVCPSVRLYGNFNMGDMSGAWWDATTQVSSKQVHW